ncbi:DUF523 domain-containing protein [Nitrospira sp. Kam-Ns4a]
MIAGPRAGVGPIRIGISACLLGQRVRYDGGHQSQPWTARLGKQVEWVPVCPEVEMGLGTPREPIQLVGSPARPRLVGVASGREYTDQMRAYAAAKLRALARLGLCGYVFKDRSPSCGLARDEFGAGVPRFAPDGRATASPRLVPAGTNEAGLFARAFRTRFPRLPVAGDGWLRDPAHREEFLRQVVAYAAAARRRRAGRRGRRRAGRRGRRRAGRRGRRRAGAGGRGRRSRAPRR